MQYQEAEFEVETLDEVIVTASSRCPNETEEVCTFND